jgi:penicillin amidase
MQELRSTDGAFGTANGPFPGYTRFLTYDWDAEFRQRRIDQLVLEKTGHTVSSMRAAQLDVVSLAARELKALMIAAARQSPEANAAVLRQLEVWDGAMSGSSSEPLLYMAWVREAVKAIWADDLGPSFGAMFAPDAKALIRVLQGRATGRDWCDDRTTPEHETCGIVLARALNAALADLERRYGRDRSTWLWGRAHKAIGEHRIFGHIPVLAWLFNVEVPSPGGTFTLNRGGVEFGSARPFANHNASTYRAIYDFADLEGSLYIQTTGQSGNPFSRYYRNFAPVWAAAGYIRIPTRPEAISADAIGTWRLAPK